MNRSLFTLLLVGSLVFLFACTDSTSPTSAMEDVDSGKVLSEKAREVTQASGNAHLIVGDVRKFTLSATDNGNKATGRILINYVNTPGVTLQGNVTCVTKNGNKAWVAGDFGAQDANPFDAEYWTLIVEDNGEGANASPDRSSLVLSFNSGEILNFDSPADFCSAQPDTWYYLEVGPEGPGSTVVVPVSIDLYDLQQGNLQVK